MVCPGPALRKLAEPREGWAMGAQRLPPSSLLVTHKGSSGPRWPCTQMPGTWQTCLGSAEPVGACASGTGVSLKPSAQADLRIGDSGDPRLPT